MKNRNLLFNNRSKAFYYTRFLIFLLFLSLPGYALMAQENQDQSAINEEGTSTIKDEPTIIPVSEIAASSEKDLLSLSEMRKEIDPTPEIIELENKLPDILNKIKEAHKEVDFNKLEDFGQRKLEDLKQYRLQQKMDLEEFKQTLSSRISLVEALKSELTQISDLWHLTQDNAVKEKAPLALKKRMRLLLSAVKEIEKKLLKRMDILLTNQNRISDEELKIIDGISKFDSAILQQQQNLFSINSPPLWKVFLVREDSTTITGEIKQLNEKKKTALIDYFSENINALFLHLFIFTILLFFFLSLRWKSRQWDIKDETSKTTAHIINRPFSAAFLITLSLTRIIHPHAPVAVYDLNSLLVLIPLIRLLSGLVFKNMKSSLYFLSLIYILHQVQIGLSDNLLLERLALLLITVLTGSGLGWLVRPGGAAAKIGGGRLWKAVLALSRLAVIILIIALFANIIGSTRLAVMLTHGTLKSLYLAVVLLTLVYILNGIITLILQTKVAQSITTVYKHHELLKERSAVYLNVIAFISWALWTLSLFNIYTPLANFVTDMLKERWSIGSVSISLGDIIAFVLTIWISIFISRLIRFFLEEDVLPHFKLPRGVPGSISMLTHYIILVLGFIIAMSAAGIEWSRLALLAGALGVGIGFGLQDVVNNFVSGLILIFERPIKLRDVVEVGSLKGVVKRIGIRSSTIRTFEGAEVIVPNGHLISKEVTNWTLSDRQRRVSIKVGVAYGTNPNKVLEILSKIAVAHPDIQEKPEPYTLFTGFGESSLDFELRFWTANMDTWLELQTEITVQIDEALKKAKIEIPFPQRDLHIHKGGGISEGVNSKVGLKVRSKK